MAADVQLDRDSERAGTGSVDRALALLAAVGEASPEGIGLSDLARRTGVKKATAHRLLRTLEQNGAVGRAGTRYRLGRLVRKLGATIREETRLTEAERAALTAHLLDLYEETHLTVHLTALDGAKVVYLNKLHGHHRVLSPSRIGVRIPAYCTASGKALLAHTAQLDLPEHEGVFRTWTARTIRDRTELDDELAAVREYGIAHDRGELSPGLTCIAMPVFDAEGRAVAAMSVSGAPGTFDDGRFTGSIRRITHRASAALAKVR